MVTIIFLDLVASTVQLLPLFLRAGEADEKGEGGDREGSTGAWVIRLVVRLLQVRRSVESFARYHKAV